MPSDRRGTDMRPDSEGDVYSKPDIVNKIAQNLQKFGGGQDDYLDNLEPPTSEPDKEPTDKSEPKPEPEPDKEPAADDKSISEPKGEPTGDDDKKVIPDNYYRALIHQGWEPEKISEMYEKDPDALLEWSEKAYEAMNNLSQQFSALGRARIELEKQQGELRKAEQPQPPQQSSIDVEKLRQKYEDDPFGATVDLLKAFTQPVTQTPSQTVQTVPQTATRGQFDEDIALVQHLIQFFGADDMKAYGDFYGSIRDETGNPNLTADHLTAGQAANRHQVLVEADRIIAGAAFQGQNIPIQEALAMAHYIVSAPIAKQIARSELVAQVQKKAKGVTLRPNSRKTSVSLKEGQLKTEQQLEKDTEARIQQYKEGKPLK